MPFINMFRPKLAAIHPPEPAYCMEGRLYGKSSDKRGSWIMLTVPNELVRGVYTAINEPGVELPIGDADGRLEAHISVMRPEELERVGGIDKITERGKSYKYNIGQLVSVVPAGWADMERCWMLNVHSPQLQELRRAYGLSSLPKNGEYMFHITVACRRRGVLGRNSTSKSFF